MKRIIIPIAVIFLLVISCSSPQMEVADYPVIRKNGQYGFITKQGSQAISPQFAYANPFSEGLAAVNIGGTVLGKEMPADGKWGFFGRDTLDGKFKILINPVFDSPPVLTAPPYDIDSISLGMHEAYLFSEGFSAVYKNNRWGYINRAGKPISLDANLVIQSARRFSNGLASFFNGESWGYLAYDAKAGKIKEHISPKYLLPVDFYKGYAFVMTKDKERMIIDTNGEEVVIEAPYKFQSNIFDDYAAIKATIRVEGAPLNLDDGKKIGFYNIKTKNKIEPQFDQVGHFGMGLCPVLVGSKAGSSIEYPDVVDFADFSGGKWGFIDESGHFFINPIYDDARSFSDGLAAVKVGNHWGYIDDQGREVFPPRFKHAGYFKRGIARVKMGSDNINYFNKEAYINKDGDVIWIEQ